MKKLPYYWQLSAFYFFYFGSLGGLFPYLTLYLHNLGFNAQAIGQLFAILLGMKIIAPNLVAWIAAHTGQQIALIRLSALLTILFFLPLLIVEPTYLWVAITFALFSFFWHPPLPLFEATTLAHIEKQAHRYSQIRLWGSIGFIFTVILFGWLFESFSVTLLPFLLIGLFLGIWLSSLLVPEKKTTDVIDSHNSFYQILKRPSVIALLLISFLMQMSHGPYYTFYSIYLEESGYSSNLIGQLWALGVLAEVGLFLIMHHLLIRFCLKRLLIITFALTALRWLLIAYYVQSLPLLLFAQLFHAASFAMFHAIAIQLIREYFAASHQSRAQALYSSTSFGAGGALGSLLSGYTWEYLGAHFSYLWAALICVIAIWVSWRWVGK
jgi:MFS transporter, PPP family, 3-phenylpropionic acid transporter